MDVEPNNTFNGVHASASALEGAKEVSLWTSLKPNLTATQLFKAAAAQHKASALETSWVKNEEVVVPATGDEPERRGLAFDLCEDLGVAATVALLPLDKAQPSHKHKHKRCVVS